MPAKIPAIPIASPVCQFPPGMSASGKGHQAAISIRQKGAVLWVGRLKAGEAVRVPDAPFVHLYVARGAAKVEGVGPLNESDAARRVNAGGGGLTVTSSALGSG